VHPAAGCVCDRYTRYYIKQWSSYRQRLYAANLLRITLYYWVGQESARLVPLVFSYCPHSLLIDDSRDACGVMPPCRVAIFQVNLGYPVPHQSSSCTWSRRKAVGMWHRQARCPSCHTATSIKALTKNSDPNHQSHPLVLSCLRLSLNSWGTGHFPLHQLSKATTLFIFWFSMVALSSAFAGWNISLEQIEVALS